MRYGYSTRSPLEVRVVFLKSVVLKDITISREQRTENREQNIATHCSLFFVLCSWALSSFARRPNLTGIAGDKLIQHGFVLLRADYTAKSLDVLAGCAVAAYHDRDIRVGHVDALVQHAPGNQLGISAVAERLEDVLAFVGRGAVGDRRHGQRAANCVDQRGILGKHQHFIATMLPQEPSDLANLGLGVERDHAGLVMRSQRLPRDRVAATAPDELAEEVAAARQQPAITGDKPLPFSRKRGIAQGFLGF